MKYAVVAVSGRQYQVKEGEELVVDRMEGEEGKAVKFDQVLLVRDDGGVKVGAPVVKGAVVTGKIAGQSRGEKIRVTKYKAKTGYRRVRGFRADETKIKVEKISLGTPEKEEKKLRKA